MKYLTLLLILLTIGVVAFPQGIPDPLEEDASNKIGFVQNMGQVTDENGSSLTSVGNGLYFHSVNTLPASYYYTNKISFVYPIVIDSNATIDTLRRLDMSWIWSDVGNSAAPTSFEQTEELYNYYFPHCAIGCDQIVLNKGLLYEDIYEDIDLRIYSNSAWIKIYYVLKPGSNRELIRLNFAGYDNISVNQYLTTITIGNKDINLPSGIAYEYDGNGTNLLGWQPEFELQPDSSIKLSAGGNSYDNNKTLVFEIFLPAFAAGSSDLKNINKSIVHDNISDMYWDIDHDAGGNPHICGYSENAPVIPTNSYKSTGITKSNIVVVKLNASDLSRSWVTLMGGNDEDGKKWYGISLDNEGNTFISANTNSTDLYSATPSQSVLLEVSGAYWDNTNTTSKSNNIATDQLLVKLNTSGVRTWATLFGSEETNSYDDIKSGDIIVDKNNNNVYMTSRDKLGSAEVAQPSGNGGYFNQNYSSGRCYIVKFNGSTLAREWCTYYGTDITYIKNFAIDANQNILMTGYSGYLNPIYSGRMFNQNFAGGGNQSILYDGFIGRFDEDWNIDWQTCIGGYYNDFSNRININSAGTIAIGGSTWSDGSSSTTKFPIQQNGSSTNFSTWSGSNVSFSGEHYEGDAFVATFDGVTLEMINSTFIGGENGESVFGLASNSSTNDLFAIGSTLSPAIQTATNQPWFLYDAPSNSNTPFYVPDYFITGFSSGFNLNWATFFGSTGTELLSSAAFYYPYLYIVGNTHDVIGIPYQGFPTNPSQTGFIGGGHVARFDMELWPLGVKEENNSLNTNLLKIYPNPANSIINISMDKRIIDVIRIYDLAGSTIKKHKFEHNFESIDISDLDHGIYFIEITDYDGKSSIGKFIKN